MTKYRVTIARDRTEYAEVVVVADSETEAGQEAERLGDSLPDGAWRPGGDTDGLYVSETEVVE